VSGVSITDSFTSLLVADAHLHSTYSDGKLDPSELLLLGGTRGLDLVAITDHNTTAGSLAAFREWRPDQTGPCPVPAQEISTEERLHLLVYGLQMDLGAVKFDMLPSLLRRALDFGGAVVLAHPWSIQERPGALAAAEDLARVGLIQGVELISAAMFYEEFGSWRRAFLWYRERLAHYGLAMLGGSDFHDHSQGYAIGIARTLYRGRPGGTGDFVAAILAGKTAAWIDEPLLIEHGLASRFRRETTDLADGPREGIFASPDMLTEIHTAMGGPSGRMDPKFFWGLGRNWGHCGELWVNVGDSGSESG